MILWKWRWCWQVESNPDTALFPVNAGHREGFHGVLDAFHRAALGFDDF